MLGAPISLWTGAPFDLDRRPRLTPFKRQHEMRKFVVWAPVAGGQAYEVRYTAKKTRRSTGCGEEGGQEGRPQPKVGRASARPLGTRTRVVGWNDIAPSPEVRCISPRRVSTLPSNLRLWRPSFDAYHCSFRFLRLLAFKKGWCADHREALHFGFLFALSVSLASSIHA